MFTNSSAVIGDGEGTVDVKDGRMYVEINDPPVSLTWTKTTRGINIFLKDPSMRGNVCGLLGNANGIAYDDLMKPDGLIVSKNNADIYEFGNSWEVPESCPRQ
ncbi:mucin-2-like [Saccoglossus kowalevskii]